MSKTPTMTGLLGLANQMKAAEELAGAQRKQAATKACSEFLTELALLPLRAWLIMLGVGVVHGAVLAVPTISFGAALLLVLAVSSVAGAIHQK
jgi:hypothetical protein